jgi:hypothetical protein
MAVKRLFLGRLLPSSRARFRFTGHQSLDFARANGSSGAANDRGPLPVT